MKIVSDMLNSFIALPVFASQHPIIYAFVNSDVVGMFICVLLLLASTFMLTLTITTLCALKKAFRDNDFFIRQFNEVKNPLSMRERAKDSPAPAANVYEIACQRIEKFNLRQPGGGRRAMSDDELAIVHSAMEVAIDDQMLALEKKNVWISIAVSGGPFLGLFGTVWGITIAFATLAQSGRADVQTLAPGISGALLTTVLGLILAIPAMLFYNFTVDNQKRISVQLDRFADLVNSKLKLEQIKSYELNNQE